jgi:hypothetical protein
MAQDVALAKAPMPVLGKGRMICDIAIQTEPFPTYRSFARANTAKSTSHRFRRVLLQVDRVFKIFRTGFRRCQAETPLIPLSKLSVCLVKERSI